jgi:hypothetical protein
MFPMRKGEPPVKSKKGRADRAANKAAKAERKVAKAEARVTKAEARLERKKAKLEAAKQTHATALSEAEESGASRQPASESAANAAAGEPA